MTKAATRGTATLRFPITKSALQPDGSLIVTGPCTNDARDLEGQRVDSQWAARKLGQFFEDFGAPIRVEHDYDRPPAGKGLDVIIDEDSKTAYLRARVAQKDAIADVKAGRLKDFSLGMVDIPLYLDPDAPAGRIGDPDTDEGYIAEISLVGTGAAQGGPGCAFNIVKRANKSAPIETPGLEDGLSKALRREAKKATKSNPEGVNQYTGGGGSGKPTGGGKPSAGGKPSSGLRVGQKVSYTSADGSTVQFGRYAGRVGSGHGVNVNGDLHVVSASQLSPPPGKKTASKEKSMSNKATKAADDAVTKAAMPDGHVSCDACNGSGTIKGELPCPKCDSAGHIPAGKAKKAAKVKAAAKDADSDVGDALDDASDDNDATGDDISDAQQAQAADDATEGDEDKAARKAAKAAKAARKAAKAAMIAKAEGAVSAPVPAQDGAIKPGKKPLVTGDMATGKAKKAKAPKEAPVDDDGDKCKTAGDGDEDAKGAFPGAAKPFGGKKKGKASKSADVPYLAVRAHDSVCPAYANKAVKSAYGDVSPAQIDPEFFQEALAGLASSRKAAPGSISEAGEAFASSVGLVKLAPKTFAELRRAAHKGWLDANPDLPGLKPGLIDPATLRRGFLASADSTVSHTTEVPSPDLKAPARPHDMPGADAPSTGNYAAKSATAVKARQFYTNSSKDEHAVMMGQLHDFITTNYPGCCPIADAPGTPIDSDGQMGRPAEMNSPLPPAPADVASGDANTVGPVRDTARANKAAKRQARADKAAKGLRRQVRQLERTVKSMASAPDPRAASSRSHTFARRGNPDPSAAAKLAEARAAADLIRTRDSRQAEEGLEDLRRLRSEGAITNSQFAEFATAAL